MFKQRSIRDLTKYIRNSEIKQGIRLFSENILGIPISIITSMVFTRFLGPENYGNYQFVIGIYQFAIVFISFGVFQAGNRALVLNNSTQKAKEYFGAELIITLGLFVILTGAISLFACYDTNIQEKDLGNFIIFTIPFGVCFLLQKYFETLLQADQKINLLFISRFYPRIGFLLGAGIIYLFFFQINANKLIIVWLLYSLVRLSVYGLILFKLEISFKKIRKRLLEIWNYNYSFGLHVYFGSIFALGFSSLTPLLVSYFGQNNSGVGFLTLAATFSGPLTFIPNTIATIQYKNFAQKKQIPPKMILITLFLSLSALFCLWVIIGPFVNIAYGKEYHSVIKLTIIISLGLTAHGFADFFNRFLGANGQGKSLRNSAFVVGISGLVFSFLFIPKWGEVGAAYVRLSSGFIYFGIIMRYYYKCVRMKTN